MRILMLQTVDLRRGKQPRGSVMRFREGREYNIAGKLFDELVAQAGKDAFCDPTLVADFEVAAPTAVVVEPADVVVADTQTESADEGAED